MPFTTIEMESAENDDGQRMPAPRILGMDVECPICREPAAVTNMLVDTDTPHRVVVGLASTPAEVAALRRAVTALRSPDVDAHDLDQAIDILESTAETAAYGSWMRDQRATLLRLLRDPAWQGIGGIGAILALILTIVFQVGGDESEPEPTPAPISSEGEKLVDELRQTVKQQQQDGDSRENRKPTERQQHGHRQGQQHQRDTDNGLAD